MVVKRGICVMGSKRRGKLNALWVLLWLQRQKARSRSRSRRAAKRAAPRVNFQLATEQPRDPIRKKTEREATSLNQRGRSDQCGSYGNITGGKDKSHSSTGSSI